MPDEKGTEGGLSHLDERGAARMVDVSEKKVTLREAVAYGFVAMKAATLGLIREGKAAKGDVLAAARLAGIMAAKRTHELIPLCHSLPLERAGIEGHGEDRRRDGSADCRRGRCADYLRHVQGGRPRHDHWSDPARAEEWRGKWDI